jgi:hypothetical protein
MRPTLLTLLTLLSLSGNLYAGTVLPTKNQAKDMRCWFIYIRYVQAGDPTVYEEMVNSPLISLSADDATYENNGFRLTLRSPSCFTEIDGCKLNVKIEKGDAFTHNVASLSGSQAARFYSFSLNSGRERGELTCRFIN